MSELKGAKFTHEVTQSELEEFLSELRRLESEDDSSLMFLERLQSYIEDETVISKENYSEDEHSLNLLFLKSFNSIVGFIWIGEYSNEYAEDDEIIEADLAVWDIYLLPRYRRLGIGNQLYREALNVFKAEVTNPIVLADPHFENAVKFFNSLGFQQVEGSYVFLKSENLLI